MSVFSRIADFLSLEPYRELEVRTQEEDILSAQIAALRTNVTRPWRLPSIADALGVPAISRAVTLIANTTGSLSMQGFRNGELMTDTPRVAARPNPFETPRDSYRDMSYQMATSGETVLWIASRDGDGLATALVIVPLAELSVEENTRNRLYPVYTWGNVKSTRYSPANPSGEFVHITYLREPGQLRGQGPLQLSGAASSVAVEAQEWAANFYAEGGSGGTLIKHSGVLSPTADANGLTEADLLRAQWVGKPNNIPRVIDQMIEDVKTLDVNTQGAQMLEAREHQNGDAARMYGIPGALLEYGRPGSSLTYQNIAEVFTLFVKGCLAPNYLEPIEQGLSDLLPRSTACRFYVDGLLRADIKTRFEVYEKAVTNGIMSVEEARQKEGMSAGNVEYAPVLPSPPQAVPSSLPQLRSEVRCDGLTTKRRSGVTSIGTCGKLLTRNGTFVGLCPRCKKEHRIELAMEVRAVPAFIPPSDPPVASPAPEAPEAPTAPTDMTIRELAELLPAAIAAAIPQPEPQPAPQPAPAPVVVPPSVVELHIDKGAIVNNMPALPAIENRVEFRAVTPVTETEVGEEMLASIRSVESELRDQRRPRIVDKRVVRDDDGRIVGVREVETA